MSLSVKGKSVQVAPRRRVSHSQGRNEPVPIKKPLPRTSVTEDDFNPAQKLTSQFAESLQQQIKLLHYENEFLKKQEESREQRHEQELEKHQIELMEKQQSLEHQQRLLDQQQKQFLSQQQKQYETMKTSHIMARGNEVSMNGETWCRLPPHHPNLQTIFSDRSSTSYQRAMHAPTYDEYRKREYSVPCSRPAMPKFEQRHFEPKHESSRSFQDKPTFMMDNSDLLNDLEESTRKLKMFEKELYESRRREEDQQKVIMTLTMKIKRIEEERIFLKVKETNERKGLAEEMLEMQKRLDEMTPMIAEKEMKLVKAENEKLELNKKIRMMNTDITNMQVNIEQLKEEILIRNTKVTQTSDELKLVEQRFRMMDKEITEMKIKEASYQEKISAYVQTIREYELKHVSDSKIIEQLKEENEELIKESAMISGRLTKFEQQEVMNSGRTESERILQAEAMAELKATLLIEQQTVQALRSRIDIMKARYTDLEVAMTEREKYDESQIFEKERFGKELNALHALSKSLTAENKLLREEKLGNEEIIDEQRGKIRALEATLRSSRDIYHEKEKRTAEKVEQLEEDARRRQQKYLEFEEMSSTIQQITALLPSSRATTATSKSVI